MKNLFGRMPLVGFGLAAGIFIVASVASYYGSMTLHSSTDNLNRSHMAAENLHVLSESLLGAQSSFRGFLLTGNPDMMQEYPMQVAAFHAALAKLREQGGRSADAPGGNLSSIIRYSENCFDFMNTCLALDRVGRRAKAIAMIRSGQGKQLLDRAESAIKPMMEAENSYSTLWRGSVNASALGLAWILGLSLLSTVILMMAAAGAAIRENVRLRRVENSMRDSENRTIQFLNALPVGIFVMEANGTPYFANKSAEQILGRGLYAQLRGDQLSAAYGLRRLKSAEPYPTAELPAIKALAGQRSTANDIEVRRPDGSVVPLQVWGTPVFDSAARVTYSITAFADMTEHQALLVRLEELSRYDPQTGFYNRRSFLVEAELQLKMAVRQGTGRILFFVDMDNLKWINDTLGHQEGDQALHDLTRVLRVGFRDTDLIGRLGGDEFVVLASKNPNGDGGYSGYFHERLDRINRQAGRKYKLDFSFGQVEFDPANPVTLEELISEADELMYSQKRAKKGLGEETDFPGSGGPFLERAA
jgi:diguanylate cyclase (GGDEF)-like protein/PAS domain S-box-containing protein